MDVMDARPASSTQDIRQNPAGGPLFPPAGAAKGPTEHSWQTVWPYCEATTGEDDPTDICGDPLLDTFEAVSWQAATPSESRGRMAHIRYGPAWAKARASHDWGIC